MNSARSKISVCICTYNRSALLAGALEALAAQTRAPDELLVVDNNSTDTTRSVADSYKAKLPLRYLFEPKQGLSNARNCALSAFSGDFLIFFDDDVRLSPTCLEAYAAAFATYPEAGYFGGRIEPRWSGPAPSWVREPPLPLLDGLLVWHDMGRETRPFADEDSGPFGANLALAASLIAKVGPFNADLGCKGGARGRGEETDWITRARHQGARGIYVGTALCHHIVDPARLTLARIFDYGVESGAAHRVLAGARGGSVWRFAGFALRGVAQLLRGRGDGFRQCVINMGIEYDALRHGAAN